METFESLYNRLTKAAVDNNVEQEVKSLKKGEFDSYQLDCLLNPKKHPLVLKTGDCECSAERREECANKCLFNALYKDENSNIQIDKDLCVGCTECVADCRAQKLTASKDILPALAAVKNAKGPVYAMIAPAFVNQYSSDVTPGKLRSAFKQIGFSGMVEVALFADILTLKEALEFDKNIQNENDYQLTSCCCPMWIAMIKRVYKELVPHVPGAVSPMVACGRAIKTLYPDATTIFIGPCIAKKAEAREKDVADSTDFVLTFQEIQDIFDFAGVNPAELEEDDRDHSSRAGRIYAGAGGVSEAVENTVNRLNPNRKIKLKSQHADGVKACKEMLNEVLEGKMSANFLEGMGCVGGCVGGPKILIPKEEGRKNVFEYGDQATYKTPIDNPYVIKLLEKLGFETVESLIEHSDIFVRNF